MSNHQIPFPYPDKRDLVRNIDIRRAMFAVLFAADEPLTVGEILYRLEHDHRIMLEHRQTVPPRQRVADMLRFQLQQGRVARVARATYVAIPESMSVSTRWRCRNWRRLRDRYWYTI